MEDNWNQFWHNRWAKNEIGFHQAETEQLLVRFLPKLSATQVLVPLCGKTKDMIYLAQQGHQVIGVELSATACETFFNENQLPYQVETVDTFQVYRSEKIQIFCGDFFQLQAKHIQDVELVYDRAAMIALPEKLRVRYTTHLKYLFSKSSVQILLIVIAYEQSRMNGPPFSVQDDEVHALYEPAFNVTTLDSEPDIFQMKNGGRVEIFERVYLVQNK